ncbi:hypothetical protein HYX13_05390 [Candidatus Woesearchaeota archaeon]|nr:hypothetical protein [Candidatus Woesearchaeota archaeon]
MTRKTEIVGTIDGVVTEEVGSRHRVFTFRVKERNTDQQYGFKHSGILAEEMAIGHEVMATLNETGKEMYALVNRNTGKGYFVTPADFSC